MGRGNRTQTGRTASRRSVVIGLGLTALAAGASTGALARGMQLAQNNPRPTNRPAEGGVGGTGIVGILASLDVPTINGLRLSTPADVIVRGGLGQRRLEDLGVGQAVTIEAYEDANGALVARSIAVDHALIGPIENLIGSKFRSLGVDVFIEPGAALIGPDGAAFTPAPGQRVAVSGLWRGEAVVASRLDLLEQGDRPDQIAGTVKPGATRGSVRIGALDLVLPSGVSAPPPGSYATATGRRAGKTMVAERVVEGRFQDLAGPLTRLSVEGYLEPISEAPGFAVSGLGHSFDTAARLVELSPRRALFVGPYEGDFQVEFGLPLPEGVAPRRTVLAALDDGFAPRGAVRTR